MRLDMGLRANTIVDHRVAVNGKVDVVEEYHESLSRYAL